MISLAINGYGRIGRIAHRVILEAYSSEIDVVAINVGSSTDVQGWMYLLKYDSVYGPLSSQFTVRSSQVSAGGKIGTFVINGKEIAIFCQKDPSMLPWKDLDIDVVLECTGALRTEEKLKAHITAGAKKSSTFCTCKRRRYRNLCSFSQCRFV